MIFPQNVQKITTDSAKLRTSEKTKLIVGGTIFVNFVIALFSVTFFQSIGVPWWYPIGVQLLLFGVILVFILRVFVFKEDEKLREYEDRQMDSFAKYYKIRNIDQEIPDSTYPVFEFNNGSTMAIIKFRMGSNDDIRAKNNREVFEEIYRILGYNKLEFSQIETRENLREALSEQAKYSN